MESKTTTMILTAMFAITAISAPGYSQNHFSGARNMGAIINSTSDEQGGVIAPSGLSLYFTSNRPGGLGGQDLYFSQRATLGSAWGAPQHLGALSSAENELAPSFSRDGRSMFFTSNRLSGLGNNDIFLSTRSDPNNDFGWTAPVNLGAPINTQFSERGATYFEDPTTGAASLIFAREFDSTMPPFHDLYQSERNADGTFITPTLIDELNSIGSEIRATVRSDGLEVFIHTSRPGGLGPPPPGTPTFDTFVSTRDSVSSPWGPPALLAGLNTPLTEGSPGLSPDGSILYFHSNRPGGFGGNDLYSATRCSLYSDAPCVINRTVSDFNADGITDLSIFRPSDGTWWVEESGTRVVSVRRFGASGDRITPGDYDGDGRLDLAVFRPTDMSWWILRSSDSSFTVTQFGLPTDTPTPGDYDGDSKTDIAVFRNGTWYIKQGTGGVLIRQFGSVGDVPVAGVQ